MAITSVTLTNPGAELADTSGWTQTTGAGFAATTLQGGKSPQAGSYFFFSGTGSVSVFSQTVAVPGALEAAIDAGTAAAKLSAYQNGFDSDTDNGRLTIDFLDAGAAVLASYTGSYADETVWTLKELYANIPPLTRSIKIGTYNRRVTGTNCDVYWDTFALEISDDSDVDYPETALANQLGVYALANAPAAEAEANQFGVVAVGSAETANTFHDVKMHQYGAYALVRGFPDRQELCAWTFTQDDHDFYVLKIGTTATLVYDTLSKQWSEWRSPGYNYWRAIDGCAWEGYNVAIDPLSNKIWQIDPTGRLDYETTPIRSVVTGMFSERFRKHVNCFMAELAVSEAEPPAGIDASTVGISLRTYQQSGVSANDHGEITGENTGDDITVRWYGLGLAKSPGHVFEIIDTGYARRIDGFDVDIGDFNGSD